MTPSAAPAAPDYLDVLRRARAALASGVGVEDALREILSWTDLRPSPVEALRIQASGGDPADFLAFPVIAQIHPQASGGIAQTNMGEMVFFNLQFTVPMSNLRPVRKLLDATGKPGNPADGMLPVLDARLVIPEKRVNAELLRILDILPSDA